MAAPVFWFSRILESGDACSVFDDVDDGEGGSAASHGEVVLLETSSAEGHQGVGDEAPSDAVADGVGDAHDDDGEEAASDGDPIVPFKLFEVLEHANADVNQGKSGNGVIGEGAQTGIDDKAQTEEEASDDGGKASAGTGSDAGGGFDEGSDGGGAADRAEDGSNGINDHRGAIINGDAALVIDHASAGFNADEGSGCVEEVNEEKGEGEGIGHRIGEDVEAVESGAEDFAKVADGSDRVFRIVEAVEAFDFARTEGSAEDGHDNDGDDDGEFVDPEAEFGLLGQSGQGQDDDDAEQTKENGEALEVAQADQGGVVVGDDAHVLEADEADKEANARGNREFQ